jgi:hypothetical protein
VKLKGYKVVTHTDTNNLYLQPSIKGTKDLDIELEDHITVRDYIAGELTRHIGLADSLFSSEEVLASPLASRLWISVPVPCSSPDQVEQPTPQITTWHL